MKDIQISKANLDDVNDITRLWVSLMNCHRGFTRPYGLDEKRREAHKVYMEKLINGRKSQVLVAKKNKQIIGYITGQIDKKPPIFKVKEFGYLSGMFVKESHRQKGVGEQLTRTLLEWFKEKGIKHVELDVWVYNEIGIDFWRKMGFEDYNIRMIK